MAATNARASAPSPHLYVPDLCAPRSVLAVVLIVELVAIVFAVAQQGTHRDFWIDLSMASLFLLWLGLCCATLLCRARDWLASMSARTASMTALGMLLAIVGIVSEIVYWIGHYLSHGVEIADNIFPDDQAAFLIRNLTIGFIVAALTLRYFYIANEWRRSVEQAALSRLHALQARIRPHFLFNSMNTIAALTRSDPAKAEQAVEDLADLFRASLNDATLQISLEQELEIAKTHVRVEQLRLGERLKVVWDLADVPLDAPVPSLIIQPLIENAVYHGIEKLPAGGEVKIHGRAQGDMLVISVWNAIAADEQRYREREGNKMALENIRQRLDLAWPGRTRVDVLQEATYFEVTLTFPFAPTQLLQPR